MTDVATSPDAAPAPGAATVTPLPSSSRPARAGRRVRRVLRRIEPVSVLRFSLLFYACVAAVVLVAGVVLWVIASAAGVVGNVEEFVGDLFALEEFSFEAGRILQASVLGGIVLVLLGTALNVLAAVLYNLISDVVGGIEVTVLEEDRPAGGARGVV